MIDKTISLIAAIVVFLNCGVALAEPATPAELTTILGHYVGGKMNFSGSPTSPQTCSVDIEINSTGQVVFLLSDVQGISLYHRDARDESYQTTVMPQLSYPLLNLRKFLQQTTSYSGEISQAITIKNFKTTEDWSLRLNGLGSNGGFVQMTYNKQGTFDFSGRPLAYIDSLTGCYDLVKK